MNEQQAENLRILIRHAEGAMSRDLDMQSILNPCGTPACMLGEAICVIRLPAAIKAYEQYKKGGTIWPGVRRAFGASIADSGGDSRLFGDDCSNAWKRGGVTPQEWAAEARKVLAENGYSMDDTPKPLTFPDFMAKVCEPVQLPAETEESLTVSDVLRYYKTLR